MAHHINRVFQIQTFNSDTASTGGNFRDYVSEGGLGMVGLILQRKLNSLSDHKAVSVFSVTMKLY